MLWPSFWFRLWRLWEATKTSCNDSDMSMTGIGPKIKTRDWNGFDMDADDEEFGAGPNVPGQAASRAARGAIETWLQGCEARPAWEGVWRELMEQRAPLIGRDGELALNERGHARSRRRWTWRQAAYIAWMCTPKAQRTPGTLEELATLLGLKGAGAFRHWRARDKGIDEAISRLPRQLLAEHLVDAYAATVAVATSPDPKGHQDRRLLFELVGVLGASRGATAVAVAGTTATASVDLNFVAELGEEELDQLLDNLETATGRRAD